MPSPGSKLLAWYDRQKRDLPWRRAADPWAVLVSEFMLQQTRVDVVLDYYTRFMKKFPNPAVLARAGDDEVLNLWSGLGYYRRARNLKQAAIEIVERHDGKFPTQFEDVIRLKGVGRYTAGAVMSIAFDEPFPVVDGNVTRVLSRLYLVAGDPASTILQNRMWEIAAQILDQNRPGDFNQALMELGALVCIPGKPRCLLCPLESSCEAKKKKVTGEYPSPRKRRSTIQVRLAAVIVRKSRSIAVLKRASRGLMAGMIDFPGIELDPDGDASPTLKRWLKEKFGLKVRNIEFTGQVKHTITHRRITVDVYTATLISAGTASLVREQETRWSQEGIAPRADEGGLRFVSKSRAAGMALSSLARKILSTT